MGFSKLINKAIAPIFIGALVFCSSVVFSQDFLYKPYSRSEAIRLIDSTIIFTNNYYKTNSGFLDASQVTTYDFSKKQHKTVTIRLKDWGFAMDCIPLKDSTYIITGIYIDDKNIGFSRFYILRLDSCFNVLWAKVLETNEEDGYQVDYPVYKVQISSNRIYVHAAVACRKNFFWQLKSGNYQTSTMLVFDFEGRALFSKAIFSRYQKVNVNGSFQKLDSVSLIHFSSGLHTRNLDHGGSGWRKRPLYTILDTGLNVLKQQAFFHFSDTTGSFRARHKLNDHESLFGGAFHPRPHTHPIRSRIPLIIKVNTTTGQKLVAENIKGYTEERRDGFVADFFKNNQGVVAIVTTLINDENGEIVDTTSISFVQFDSNLTEQSLYEFRPINKELLYEDHSMYNDTIMYILARIVRRPGNGSALYRESAIFKVNTNTFEVLDWDSVGLPTDSFCTSEMIYEDGDIDFEPFYINRNYVDSSLLSVAEMKSKVVQVYPNPAQDKIKIKINLVDFNYHIINLLGAKVAEGKLENEIDVSSFSTGLYILELSNNKTVYRAKFYKQ